MRNFFFQKKFPSSEWKQKVYCELDPTLTNINPTFNHPFTVLFRATLIPLNLHLIPKLTHFLQIKLGIWKLAVIRQTRHLRPTNEKGNSLLSHFLQMLIYIFSRWTSSYKRFFNRHANAVRKNSEQSHCPNCVQQGCQNRSKIQFVFCKIRFHVLKNENIV